MKKPSLRERILNYIRKQYPNYISGMEIERLTLGVGFKSSNGSRRCREMESGSMSNGRTCPIVLEKKENEKGHVSYRATPPRETTQFKKENGDVIIVHKW